MSKDENRAKWHGIINEQIASGQTQTQWCGENNINIHNFRYWKNSLGKMIVQNQNETMRFVSLKATVKQTESVTVRIGTASIEVSDAVNLSLLEDVVKVLMRYA